MPRAQDSSLNDPRARRDRRLVTGIAVSALLHGLLLSLQFGIPGFETGPGGPIQVTLAPLPAAPVSEPLSAPLPDPGVMPPLPAPAPPQAAPVQDHTRAPSPASGLRLVEPRPEPIPLVELAQAAKPKPRPRPAAKPPRRKLPRLHTPPASPLIASTRKDAAFAVAPPPLPEIAPGPEPVVASDEPDPKPDREETAVAARTAEEEEAPEEQPAEVRGEDAAAEAARIAAAEEQQRLDAEAERLLREEQERLAAQNAEQERLAAERERVLQQERAAAQLNEQRLAEQQLAQQRLEQQRLERELAEREAEQRAAAQRQAERLAADAARLAREQEERQRVAAEQQRLAQLRQLEEAQQLAAARRAAEELARQAEADERQRAAERARRQAAEEAERRLARERADEAGRRIAAEPLRGVPEPALPGSGGAGPGGPGSGRAVGEHPAGSVPGSAMATRASELLRGLSIPNVAPPRPPRNPFGGRRVLADGAERDVPLRLYVDSVRQKLERTAVLGGARFSLGEVRTDPLVSLTLRSDGSVDDVTIVRSSGRAETDDAVRRLVQLNARYAAFPPNVAARFDMIEIRRIWRFTDSLKLLEEIR